ncbi:MAG: GTP pyrophosphokinase [Cellulosilyticaceae bacterium]
MEMKNWKIMLSPYTQAVEELKIKFKGIRTECMNIEEYSPIEFVTGRVKKISSILEKAKKKNILLDQVEEKMEDIAGIRIMVQFAEDIYKVRDLIKSRDGKDLFIVEERDYISNTKPSGYRSYHVIIKYPVQTSRGEKRIFAEIQIRTLAMNFWATIEHSLRYKYKQNMPDHLQKRLSKAAEAAYVLDQEMSEIREEVLKSQEGFAMESNVVADIFGNVQALAKCENQESMNKIYEKFWQLWEESNVDKLRMLNKELEEKIKKSYNV